MAIFNGPQAVTIRELEALFHPNSHKLDLPAIAVAYETLVRSGTSPSLRDLDDLAKEYPAEEDGPKVGNDRFTLDYSVRYAQSLNNLRWGSGI